MLTEIEGRRYRVTLAPAEWPDWSSPTTPMQAVCFETKDGRWVGSVVIRHICELRDMTPTELAVLLGQAIEKEWRRGG